MIRKFSRRSGYQSLKKVLSISLTLLLALQVFNPAVLAINNVLAAPAEKVNVCHWSDEDSKYVAITISENGLNGHGDHPNDFLPGELGEGVIFNDAWCADNAPEVPPTEPEMGSLTVTKVVSGGTKQVSDFPLFVNGMPITSGVASTSIAVGHYTITETGDPDYIASFSGDCNANGVVEVEDDDSANCTITNTFDGSVGGTGSTTATLTVTKVVSGGTMQTNQFPLFLNGMSISSGVATTTVAGTYTVTETNDASTTGYTGSFSGDCNASGQVTLTNGSSKTCTLTNTFVGTSTGTTTSPFKVTILKYLDGVQATASTSNNYSFPFQATWDWTDTGGNHSGTGAYTIGSAGWGGSPAYQAWTADMTGPADYATHEITSNIDSSSHVLPVGAQCQEGMYRLVGYRTGTTLANAEAASLSTTSPSFTDINSARYIIAYNETCPNDTGTTTGTILVRKVVINDNGGTGTTSDFSFQLNGGTSTAFEIDGENSLTVATGTHNITEVASSTYSTSYNNCSNINVSAGETEICTITNNDIGTTTATGTIVVNKIVINNNSGTSTASSFPLFVGSTSVVMGATTTLPLGTYTVSETYNPNLYAQSFSGDCNSNGVVTLSGTTTKVCTITNHDIPQMCPVTQGTIVSDTNTMVGTSSAAVLSFIHPAWTADVDGASTTANWIWSTNPVATTTATTTATFTRTFTVNGSSTAATLNIATDNTYKVWINGNFVGESTDGNNFQVATQDSWNVSNFLVDGSNTLTIEVTNLPTPDVTDPQGNPAGLLYSLSWSANDCPVNGSGGENNNGQGGDNAGIDTTTTTHHKTVSRTIIRGNNGNNDNNDNSTGGTVLGISTVNPDTPIGRVLGIAQTLPGLPNTGNGEVDRARTSNLAVIVISLLVLSGAYLLQYRMLKKR